jgi:hypothetical protein
VLQSEIVRDVFRLVRCDVHGLGGYLQRLR